MDWELKWAAFWGAVALVVAIYDGPFWWPLIIGGLAVPVILFDD